MDKPRVIITSRLEQDLALSLTECAHDRLFILTDDNTARLCWPVISDFIGLRHASLITIPASDAHKDLTSLSHVWQELSRQASPSSTCPPRSSPWSTPPWAARRASTSSV